MGQPSKALPPAAKIWKLAVGAAAAGSGRSGGSGMTERSENIGFAPAHDGPIPYRQRIREYYAALGYGAPYQWAHYAEVPFQRLAKPLAECRLTLVTTAAPFQPDKGDQGPRAPYNSAAKFYTVYSGDTAKDHDLRISHVGIDRQHTSAEDPGSYFPLPLLRAAARAGRIGAVAHRFHGLPTNRSHRVTLEVDCPELVGRCLADAVDAALLLPNCPVCHQSASLAARALENADIATVVMGCAKDIVEYVGVPRLLFSDFPLGNAAGRPTDPASQRATLDFALDLLTSASLPRTSIQSPLRWSGNPDWKLDFSNIARLSAEENDTRRAECDKQKAGARGLREDASLTRDTLKTGA